MLLFVVLVYPCLLTVVLGKNNELSALVGTGWFLAKNKLVPRNGTDATEGVGVITFSSMNYIRQKAKWGGKWIDDGTPRGRRGRKLSQQIVV